MATRFVLKAPDENSENKNYRITDLQTILPTAKALYKSKKRNIWFFVVAVSSFIIMIFSKLFPIIGTQWPQDFCSAWNDFWFSLSASLVSAIIFYFFFNIIPSRNRRKRMEPLIHNEFETLLVHSNTLFLMATGRIWGGELLREPFVKGLVSLNWEDNYSYDQEKLPLMYWISREIEYLKKHIDDICLKYITYFSQEEYEILYQAILHHDIFSQLYVFLNCKESQSLTDGEKEGIANKLYDLYWKILDFSLRYKRSDELPLNAF